MHILVDRRPSAVALIDDEGGETLVPEAQLARVVAEREVQHPRWVWSDTAHWYPPLLAAGVRVDRCHDLRLVDGILAAIAGHPPRGDWGRQPARAHLDTLFDCDEAPDASLAFSIAAVWAEQRAAIAAHENPTRLTLLAAAESAGALAAVEMQHAGLPWNVATHDALLTEALGPRPAAGGRPARLIELADEVERVLQVGPIAIDSPPELVRALRRAGLDVNSTRSSELVRCDHPAIAPLLQYKTLSRLHTANGWNWLDEWVHDGRFRPTFVPGGGVTGRWASDGGGALQLPKQVRSAVQADDGWALVVADAAQLEPRILAALSGDTAMARAGAGSDLYAGMVASGAVKTRDHAKLGMLGAMYGATSGIGGQVLPRLARSFPSAIGFVELAARAGERGERVTTRLGRTSPWPSTVWRDRQRLASAETSTEADRRRALAESRAWGRFTRNFVVQGSAAEWALAWMAGVRRRLFALESGSRHQQAHLVFFVHDELIVHSPRERVSDVEQILHDAAADAARVIFGSTSVTFPVSVAAVHRYSDAK